jgi:hypothetical protein
MTDATRYRITSAQTIVSICARKANRVPAAIYRKASAELMAAQAQGRAEDRAEGCASDGIDYDAYRLQASARAAARIDYVHPERVATVTRVDFVKRLTI